MKLLIAAAAIPVALMAGFAATGNTVDEEKPNKTEDWRSEIENETPETAVFAGGCFWCIEAVYEETEGVGSAVSGYTGGEESTAIYSQVATGETDHREAVRVKYYPSVVSYEELLDVFWKSIDPTDDGGQFSDRGYQYTTAIYYTNDTQKQLAEDSKQELEEGDRFEEPIVTEIQPLDEFYVAEDKHQNYSRRRSTHYEIYKKASGREGFIKRVWDKSPFTD